MRSLALVAMVALSASCSRVEPPTLIPEGATITSMKPDGVDLAVRLDASNPNGLELTASAVKSKITVDGKDNVGAVVANEAFTLPPRKRVHLDMPLSVKWADPAQLASFADPPRTIAYQVDGTVAFTTHGMNVETPFSFKGTLSHDQIAQATSPPAPAPAATEALTASASASAKAPPTSPGKARRR